MSLLASFRIHLKWKEISNSWGVAWRVNTKVWIGVHVLWSVLQNPRILPYLLQINGTTWVGLEATIIKQQNTDCMNLFYGNQLLNQLVPETRGLGNVEWFARQQLWCYKCNINRDHIVYAPSQWETALQCYINITSHIGRAHTQNNTCINT